MLRPRRWAGVEVSRRSQIDSNADDLPHAIPRTDSIEADVALRVFAREAHGNRIKSALGNHRNGRESPATGLSANEAVMLVTLHS